MLKECALTTIDNPFDPFEQVMLWRLYDIDKHHYTSEYLARFVNLTSDMTQKEENEEIERAIDEIISLFPLGIYKKVVREVSDE